MKILCTFMIPAPKRTVHDVLMMQARNDAAERRARRDNFNLPQRKPPDGKYPNLDKLHNSLVQFLEQQGVRFPTPVAGDLFVDGLKHCLFYIDGHHATIGSNSKFRIPEVFRQFQG